MNFVFLGTFVSDELTRLLREKKARHEPGDLVQRYIVKALSEINGNKMFSICSPRIENYPTCQVKMVPFESFTLDGFDCLTVGFNNQSRLSVLFREINFVRTCKKWARSFSGDSLNIIVYSLNSTFIKGAIEIRKRVKNSKICIIVPDLPEFMSKRKWPLSWIKKLNLKTIDRLRKTIDKYVVYSEKIAEKLNLDSDKFIVVEGFIDKNKINVLKKTFFNERKICIYAGDLSPIYGIQMLIDAFEDICVNAELHIYGKDELAKNYTYNQNAKYIGCVSSEEIFEIMKRSDLLINPRPSSLELTAYSFPSKTFEYMASGTPSLMCKLSGLTNEFAKYLYFFDEETVEGFRSKIEEVLSKNNDELSKKGHDAAMFLYLNKTSDTQINRIIEFMNYGTN